MQEDEYLSYDLLGLAHLVRSGQVGESELTEFVIERIETINPALNALPFKCYDRARQQVRNGTLEGPFKGVPFLLKDIAAEYAGTPSQIGSRLYEGRVSTVNSTIVDRYLKAGLVILGKTSTSEFGLVGHIDTDAHGPTRNPWNPALSTGGSSGGAAAVVAARILPASHASDGGGSIRIPAAWSGVFGLKPSRGRVPYGPAGGEGLSGLSIPNALSLSVRDNAALLDVIAGDDEGASYRMRPPERPFLEEVGISPGRLRIAVTTSYKGIDLSPEAHAATQHAARICADLGHEIHDIEFPEPPRELRDIYRVITGVNMHNRIRRFEEATGREVREDEVEAYTWASYQAGKAMDAYTLMNALETMQALTRRLSSYFVNYDVMLTPTVGMPPFGIHRVRELGYDLDAIHELLTHAFPLTQLFNMMGYPAMSVPLYWTPEGLPLGSQFGASWGREDILFRLAGQLEQAAPWFDKRPDIASAAGRAAAERP